MRPQSIPTSNAALSAGRLPSVPPSVAQTMCLRTALTAFRIMEAERDITCFDGPAGTGKTTACTVAATESERVWRYCILPQSGNPRDITAVLYEAVFARAAKGTEREMRNVLVDRLADGDIGLIADEVHHVGLTGAQQLRHIWDQACVHGSPFPLLLIGCGVRHQLARADEVTQRIARWVNFGQINDVHEARAVAESLHPRFAKTSDKIIEGINDRIARRNVRTWAQIGKHVPYLPSTDPDAKKVTGLTGADVRILRQMLGFDEVAA